MDYKYIEQLLERYWECQTTLEEEAILHKFFAQNDIPVSLLPYASLFQAEERMAEECLSEDFDQRLLTRISDEAIGKQDVKVVPISLSQRFRPLWRAAASVAIILTIGMAVQQGFEQGRNGNAADDRVATTQDEVSLPGDSIELVPNEEVLEAVLAPSASDSLATTTTTK